MASTLKINNLDSASGTTITVPTGKQLIGTDINSIKAPGMVIQMQNAVLPGGNAQTSAGSFIDTGLSCNITPKYSNSKILILVHYVISVVTASSHARCDFRCIENGSSTQIYRMDYHGQDGTVNNTQRNMSGSGVFTCSNTNQLTFKTQVQKANGTEGTIYYKWYTESIHTMQLLEIAQ